MTKRSIGELKRFARECLLGRYTVVILAMLLSFFVPPILLIPFSIEITEKLNAAIIIYLLAAVIVKILRQLLQIGVLRMHFMLAQRQHAAFGELFWIFRNRPDRYILATVLLYAVLAVPLFLAGAVVYFFLPDGTLESVMFLADVIVICTAAELYLKYMFALIYPLYLERPEMSVLEGFQTSRRLMHGNKKRLFFLEVSFIGWQLLGLCSAGVGFVWISPYMTQTTVNFYLDITGRLEQ